MIELIYAFSRCHGVCTNIFVQFDKLTWQVNANTQERFGCGYELFLSFMEDEVNTLL